MTQEALQRQIYKLLALDHLFSRAQGPATPRYAARQRLVEALWAEAPFREVQEPSPLAELSADADFSALYAASQGFRVPVVIRGFGRELPAVQRWSPESLRARIGDLRCTVVEMDTQSPERAHSSERTLHTLPFTDFLDRLHDEPLYLHGSPELLMKDPGLLDEINPGRVNEVFGRSGSGWDEIFSATLFIGGEKVFSSIHNALGGNFFLQVLGRKRWTLVDPALTPYLGPVPSRPFIYCLSSFGGFRYHRHDPNYRLLRLPRRTVTLEPGDVLYNPPWWWHEVENEGLSIGCAMRHLPPPTEPSPTWQNHRLFSALSRFPTLYALSMWTYATHQISRASLPMRALVERNVERQIRQSQGREARLLED